MQVFRQFVALGDSLLSDDFPGPNLGAAKLLFSNHDVRFPEFTGQDLSSRFPTIKPTFLTRTGWRVPELLKEMAELKGSHEPTLVVLTVGGNDLLHFLMEGIEPQEGVGILRTRMDQLQKRIATLFPNRVLRAGNIYDPTDGTGVFQSGREIPNVGELVAYANSFYDSVFGPNLVDLHRHFRGHGMRAKDEQFDHYPAEDPSGWFMMDIEPNPRGASEIRRKFWESLV